MDFTYFFSFNHLVSRYFYRMQTHLFGKGDVVFLNVGYEEDPPMALPLSSCDERDRLYIQLYHRTATQADLLGKQVLEVGSGHGGGASYLTRTLCPASYTGLDRNRAAVDFCRRRHDVRGLNFVHGDAESLPFPDESFDAVVNVESSAAYRHFPRFLAEVARVLRPGGHFLYTDLRPRSGVAEWERALAEMPMTVVSEAMINAQVLRALDSNTRRMTDLLNQLPRGLRRIGHEYSGAEGTEFYRAMQRQKYLYRVYCLRRT